MRISSNIVGDPRGNGFVSSVPPAGRGTRAPSPLAAILLATLACWPGGSIPGQAAEPLPAKEHQLKAAFIYNFAKFVEWPAGSFPSTNSPLVIGVVGKSPISAALEATVKDRTINGRSIVVKGVETAEAARATHLLFLAPSEDKRAKDLLPALACVSVVTVGESETFVREDGIINFILEGDKCRFDINMDSAEKAGLKISAQLQKLAKTVRRRKR